MSFENDDTTRPSVQEAIRDVLTVQARSIEALENKKTVRAIQQTARVIDDADGRVVFTGIGKSGDVAKKIVSTFNSIGVSSHFIHPVEALHGDLGALSSEDVVVLISNSGNTSEMVELLQFLRSFDPTTIAITSNPESKLGQRVDHHIDTCIEEEGAIVDLVPMASTTATMTIGDSIANALMARRNFGKQEFGHFHPGGTIGKRLLLTVEDLMYKEIPRTNPTDTLAEVTVKMSDGGKGIAVICDDDEHMLGIITDGDVRRLIENESDFHTVVAEEVMTSDPITISPDVPAIRALEIIEKENITQLVVTNESNGFLGVVHVHDIMQQGLANKISG